MKLPAVPIIVSVLMGLVCVAAAAAGPGQHELAVPQGLYHLAQVSQDHRGRLDVALGGLIGEKAGGPPSHLAKITIELEPSDRLKIGDLLTIRIVSPIAGSLIVLNQEADGSTTQLFPNNLSAGTRPGEAPTRVEAGVAIVIPGPKDRFQLRIAPPLGPSRIIAIVLPADIPIGDLVGRNFGLKPVVDPDKLIEDLTRRTTATRGVRVEAITRGIGVREWTVVP